MISYGKLLPEAQLQLPLSGPMEASQCLVTTYSVSDSDEGPGVQVPGGCGVGHRWLGHAGYP